MQITCVGAIAIVIAFACSSACAQEREDVFAVHGVALEPLAARCDLILECKIAGAADPEKMYLQSPGLEATAPTEIYYKYTAKPQFPIKDTKNLYPKVTATFPAGEPAIIIYTPAKPKKSKDDPTPDAFYLSKLEKGKTYLLLLVKLPGTDKNVYYLPNNPQCVQTPDEEHVAAMAKAIDLKNWPWSKPGSGLQMAMFARLDLQPQQPTAAESTKRVNTLLHVSLAIRNTSDKPMAVNLNERDEYIAITAASGGTVVNGEVYKPREPGEKTATSSSWATCTILAPRQVAFITPYGTEQGEFSIPLRVAPAKWVVKATYKSSRDGKGAGFVDYGSVDKGGRVEPLWQGSIEASATCDLTLAGSSGAQVSAAPELELPVAWKTSVAASQPAAGDRKGPPQGEDTVAWALYSYAKIAVRVGADCRVDLYRITENGLKLDTKRVADKKSRLADVRFTTVPGLVYLLAIDTDMETKLKGSDQQRYPDYSLRLDLTGQAKGWHAIPYENANEQVLDACYRATDKGLDLHMGNAAAIQVELPETVAEPFRSGPGDPFAQAVFVFPGEGILTKTATGWAVNSMDGKLKKHFSTEKIEAMWWGKPTVKEHEFFVHARTGPGGETYRLNTSSGEMVRVKE